MGVVTVLGIVIPLPLYGRNAHKEGAFFHDTLVKFVSISGFAIDALNVICYYTYRHSAVCVSYLFRPAV
jgi:hypothetical protein